uniref:Reverse transcriptase domain-containing protein n=1 Tax=Trichogramma kaykai TaxID=54128 RepID=A0ABD2WAK1_9HYME
MDSLAILKLQETRVREVSPSPPPRRYDPDRTNDLLSSTRFPLTENTASQQSNNLSNTRISNIDSTLSGVRVRREYTLSSKITYADWLEHLKSELEHYHLIDFIDPEINLGDDPNVKKSRSIVQSLIISRVDKSYQSKLINIKDPHELLNKMKEIRKVENNLNVYSLKKDIYNITMKKNESANDFCNRFDNMLKLIFQSVRFIADILYIDVLTHTLRHCTSTYTFFADDLLIYLQPNELKGRLSFSASKMTCFS